MNYRELGGCGKMNLFRRGRGDLASYLLITVGGAGFRPVLGSFQRGRFVRYFLEFVEVRPVEYEVKYGESALPHSNDKKKTDFFFRDG